MATTITAITSLSYVASVLKNQRFNVTNQEPGLTMANTALQRMLGAPFIWRFNRKTFSFPISPTDGTDYVQAVADLGQIETQWLTDSNDNVMELTGQQSIARVSAKRRPTQLAPVYDDNAGNITFRVNAVPDKDYTVWGDYQQKAALLTSLATVFGPVPDEFGYIYQRIMLAEGGLLVNDPRTSVWQRDWVTSLLATQDGLDAQAKQIFYEQMMQAVSTTVRGQGMASSAVKSREVSA